MCEVLKAVPDGIELEKYGEIYAAPTLNVFVLSCLRCQNPYMQVQDFLQHIQSEHVEATPEAPTIENEIATPAAEPEPPLLAERSVIAAKRVTLSDIDDVVGATEVVDLTAEVVDDFEFTPTATVNKMPKQWVDMPEVHEVNSNILPEVLSPVSYDSWLPESVTALNEAAEKTAFNSRNPTQTTVHNDFTLTMNAHAKKVNSALSSKIRTVKLIPPHLPPTPLKVRSLKNIKKLLRERFKQQRTYNKADATYFCTHCHTAYPTRKILTSHLQRFHS